MAHNLDPIAQYRLVHEGIRAVAARCDGAVTLDMKGFDGQDTAYGRRIAGVLFEKLTADDHVEIARIANKYRSQIGSYTGIDVTTLSVVQDAKELTTNHQSRSNARRYEKLSTVAAARKIVLLPNGQVGVKWGNGDPDFDALVAGARKLPGRDYNRATKTNEVDAHQAVLDFATEWDMEVPADVIAVVEAKRAQVAVVEAKPQVGLTQDGKLIVANSVTGDEAVRALVFRLPGRRWNGQNNVVNASVEAATLFAKLGLRLSPHAAQALTAAQPAEQVDDKPVSREGIMSVASRAGSVNDLPAEFIALVQQAVGR